MVEQEADGRVEEEGWGVQGHWKGEDEGMMGGVEWASGGEGGRRKEGRVEVMH